MPTVKWFNTKDGNPDEPGIYRTRMEKTSPLTWWRAWDGKNWRCGRVATANGIVMRTSPSLQRELEIQPVYTSAAMFNFEWIGFSK